MEEGPYYGGGGTAITASLLVINNNNIHVCGPGGIILVSR